MNVLLSYTWYVVKPNCVKTLSPAGCLQRDPPGVPPAGPPYQLEGGNGRRDQNPGRIQLPDNSSWLKLPVSSPTHLHPSLRSLLVQFDTHKASFFLVVLLLDSYVGRLTCYLLAMCPFRATHKYKARIRACSSVRQHSIAV